MVPPSVVVATPPTSVSATPRLSSRKMASRVGNAGSMAVRAAPVRGSSAVTEDAVKTSHEPGAPRTRVIGASDSTRSFGAPRMSSKPNTWVSLQAA